MFFKKGIFIEDKALKKGYFGFIKATDSASSVRQIFFVKVMQNSLVSMHVRPFTVLKKLEKS